MMSIQVKRNRVSRPIRKAAPYLILATALCVWMLAAACGGSKPSGQTQTALPTPPAVTEATPDAGTPQTSADAPSDTPAGSTAGSPAETTATGSTATPPTTAATGSAATPPATAPQTQTPTPTRTPTSTPTPTPTPGWQHTATVVTFSHKSGFYPAAFLLTMSADNPAYTVRYTVNGDEPTGSSARYTGPIGIQDVRADTGDGEKATVVRAAAFTSGGTRIGNVATAVYFVNSIYKSFPARYHGLPVVSITVDNADLYDPSYGIFYGNNFTQHGREWERPAHITYLDEDGTLQLSIDAGVRVFGGTSRGLAQKSLKITARKEYDADNGKFRYPFFPARKDEKGKTVDEYNSFILRTGGNDALLGGLRATFYRDDLVHMLAGEVSNIDYMASRTVIVYINGTYWGAYNLRDDLDNDYLQEHYGVDKEQVAIVTYGHENGQWFYEADTGTPDDVAHYQMTIQDLISRDMRAPGNYEYAQMHIDVDNFMKYMAINLYANNRDWPQNNIRAWRYTGTPGSGYADGKWRFMLKDIDYSSSMYDWQGPGASVLASDTDHVYNVMTGNGGSELSQLLFVLLRNDSFAADFVDFVYDLTERYASPAAANAQLNRMEAALTPEFPFLLTKHWDGTGISHPSLNSWQSAMGALRTYYNERPMYMLDVVRRGIAAAGHNFDALAAGRSARRMASTSAAGAAPEPQNVLSYIVYEQDTKQILQQQNIDAQTDASLLARMMCAIVVLESSVNGKTVSVTDTVVPVSDDSSADGRFTLYASQPYTVDILLKASLLAGADNCARALAYYINPNTEYFVSLMNQTAARIGMLNTYFTNADGAASNLQRTTAYDAALFYAYAYRNTRFRSIVSNEMTYIWDNIAVINGCTAAFTARRTFAAPQSGGVYAARMEGERPVQSFLAMHTVLPASDTGASMRLIVILSAANGEDDETVTEYAMNLLNNTQSNYVKRRIVAAGDTISTYRVSNDELLLCAGSDLFCVAPVDIADYVQNISFVFNTTAQAGSAGAGSEPAVPEPPILENQVLGTAHYLLGDGSVHDVTLVAGNTIQTQSQTVNRILELVAMYRPLFAMIAVLLFVELIVLAIRLAHWARARRTAM